MPRCEENLTKEIQSPEYRIKIKGDKLYQELSIKTIVKILESREFCGVWFYFI